MVKTQQDDHKLANWLETQYAEWKANQDRKHDSLTAFAAFLGIKEPLLNQFVNGRRVSMSQMTADKIAVALGDDTIYDLVDLPKPDPYLWRINRVWHRVAESKKKYVVEFLEQEAGQGGQEVETPEPVVARSQRRKS